MRPYLEKRVVEAYSKILNKNEHEKKDIELLRLGRVDQGEFVLNGDDEGKEFFERFGGILCTLEKMYERYAKALEDRAENK